MESYFHSTFLAWRGVFCNSYCRILVRSQFLPVEFPFFPGRETGQTASPCLLHDREDDFLFLIGEGLSGEASGDEAGQHGDKVSKARIFGIGGFSVFVGAASRKACPVGKAFRVGDEALEVGIIREWRPYMKVLPAISAD